MSTLVSRPQSQKTADAAPAVATAAEADDLDVLYDQEVHVPEHSLFFLSNQRNESKYL